ncbi:hypothetical protein FOA52_010902 [Chlamydomonas sp. UWO 241]|nr:hypothetical protein FOA52_010902 [Chlamydomonas sp. UWO 241]
MEEQRRPTPDVASLMESGVPKASGRLSNGGQAIALAVHACMVHHGFHALAPPGAKAGWSLWAGVRSPYTPPSMWEVDGGLEWLCMYKSPSGRVLMLTTSLHGGGSGRVLVHALEGPHDNPISVKMLGLNLQRYFAQGSAQLAAAPSWAHTLTQGDALADMMYDEIVRHFLTGGPPPVAAAAAVAVAAAAAVAVVVLKRRSQTQS